MKKQVRPMRLLTFVALYAFLSLQPARNSFAQDYVTGSFEGEVKDSVTGSPIAGATVRITNLETGVPVAKQTDASGRFRQGLLPPGDYRIAIEKQGYVSQTLQRSLPALRPIVILPPVPMVAHAAVATATPAPTVRVTHPKMRNPNLVEVRFNITDDYGRIVSGLNKNAFTVMEGGSLRTIDYFHDNDAAESFTVGLVFALSDSASIDLVNAAKVALSHFVEELGRNFQDFEARGRNFQDYIVVTYNSQTDAIVKDTFTAGRQAADRSVVFLTTRPKMGVFEACSLAVESLEKSPTSGKVLILFTDMLDNNSLGAPHKLYSQLRESEVRFFAVGIPGKKRLVSVAKDDNSPIVSLDELTSLSGGRTRFLSGREDLSDYFTRLALGLQHTYAIGFKPSSPESESNLYRVNIKVQPPRGLPRLTVGTDEGFFWGRKPLIIDRVSNASRDSTKSTEPRYPKRTLRFTIRSSTSCTMT
ncbi:MAG: carboxypeptidase regulatory-like domain-containing protein [Acidobacteriota bacterium]